MRRDTDPARRAEPDLPVDLPLGPSGIAQGDRASRGGAGGGAAERRWQQQNDKLLRRDMAARAPRVHSHPVTLILDPATACNLACPFCPTGGGYGNIKKELLLPEAFERIVGNVRVDLLRNVVFYNWGEPFLNPHLVDYVRYFAQRDKTTLISTNFSLADHDEDFLAGVVESGLDMLVVSIDGASQESYGKYRLRGDLERVVGNMRRLDSVKRRLGSERPRVFYKMLLNRYNQHEIEAAQAIALDCGATFILDQSFWCPDEHREQWIADRAQDENANALPPIPGYTEPLDITMTTHCHQLWDSLVVNANGDVYPCCLVFKREHAVGNLVRDDVSELWNNDKLIELRRFVADPTQPIPEFDNHCGGCPMRLCSNPS